MCNLVSGSCHGPRSHSSSSSGSSGSAWQCGGEDSGSQERRWGERRIHSLVQKKDRGATKYLLRSFVEGVRERNQKSTEQDLNGFHTEQEQQDTSYKKPPLKCISKPQQPFNKQVSNHPWEEKQKKRMKRLHVILRLISLLSRD